MKISREIKTAILAIAAITLFILGFNFLKGRDIFDNSVKVYTTFENSYGIIQTTPVSYNGINVGKVIMVKNDFQQNNVVVEFTIDKAVPFTNESSVKLIKDFLGGISLALVPSPEGQPIAEGDFVPNTISAGLVDKLEEKLSLVSDDLDKTLDSADSLLINLNGIVKDKSDSGLQHAIAELNKTMIAFKNTSYSLNKMINEDQSKLNAMIDNFSETGKKFGNLADSLSNADLASKFQKLEKTMDKLDLVISGLEKGDGTLGKLLKDEALYSNLTAASKEMEELLRDFKLHPNRYTRILSKKEIPYKKEEVKE